jgi:hypothetical protein
MGSGLILITWGCGNIFQGVFFVFFAFITSFHEVMRKMMIMTGPQATLARM